MNLDPGSDAQCEAEALAEHARETEPALANQPAHMRVLVIDELGPGLDTRLAVRAPARPDPSAHTIAGFDDLDAGA